MKITSRAVRHLLPLLFWVGLLPAASAGVSVASRPPLYVVLIDRLPPSGDGVLDGLDKAQRATAFRAALQAAGQAGELPPVTIIGDGEAVPVGATRLRVYLKRWSSIRANGFTETDVLCRFYAEIVRDGHAVTRLGPCAGASNLDPAALSAVKERSVIFQDAARRAIGEMARALPH